MSERGKVRSARRATVASAGPREAGHGRPGVVHPTGSHAARRIGNRYGNRGGNRGVNRVATVDALRGVALLLMFGYHFAFDLRWFGIVAADFEHGPFWLSLRALIVTLFLGLVGVSLVLADRAGVTPAARWKRIGVIATCALAASAGSWLAFPQTFIWFGILHHIAVASILAWPVARHPRIALGTAAAVVAAGLLFADPAFDARGLAWIGFTTAKPATEDYVPLFPWFGAVLAGIAVGHGLVRTGYRALAPLAAAPRWLGWLGRHSLAVYLVHQPVLLGLLWLVVRR